MTKENKGGRKVPELRFKGFTGDWEQRKLGELTRERTERSGEGVLLSVTMHDGIQKFDSLGKKDNSSKDKSNYKILRAGDIGYNSMRMWQGASGLSPWTGIVSPAYTVIKIGRKLSPEFLAFSFKRPLMIWMFQTHSQGLTSDTWNLKFPALSKLPLKYPTLDEQRSIVSLITSLDSIIALHERKLALLKKLKQAYLQQLFPNNGNKVPKLRFAGFSKNWEQCKFSDFAKRQSMQVDNATLPTVEYEDIISGTGRLNKNVSVNPHHKKGILFESRDILFGKLRPYLDNRLFPHFQGVAVGDFWVLRSITVAPEFLYVLIQSPSFKFVANQMSGTKMPRSDWHNVARTVFTIPTIPEEQTKIGDFAAKIDKILALNEGNLSTLRELKCAYLQELFV